MNNVIVVGAILIYIAGILLGIDGNFVSSEVEAIFRCRVSNLRLVSLILNIIFYETKQCFRFIEIQSVKVPEFELYSIKCYKIETKEITLTNHIEHR